MALERLFDTTPEAAEADALYRRLSFPEPSDTRPYVYVNMAATADGKIVLGAAGGSAEGVGGSTDQKLFRRLRRHCDAALIGSGTLRADRVVYPKNLPRYVVTRSGGLPWRARFFTDAPGKAFVLAPSDLPESVVKTIRSSAHLIQSGTGEADLTQALGRLRQENGVRYLLCEGGAELNAALLGAGLVDELFLTLAPRLKGGAGLPSPFGGAGLPPGEFVPLSLLSLYRDTDEIYLRYRVAGAARAINRAAPADN